MQPIEEMNIRKMIAMSTNIPPKLLEPHTDSKSDFGNIRPIFNRLFSTSYTIPQGAKALIFEWGNLNLDMKNDSDWVVIVTSKINTFEFTDKVKVSDEISFLLANRLNSFSVNNIKVFKKENWVIACDNIEIGELNERD